MEEEHQEQTLSGDGISEKWRELLEKMPTEIFCTFKTNLPKAYKIDEVPMSISTEFNKTDLSAMIRSFLESKGRAIDEETLFEFMINGKFVQGNLKSHIIRNGINTESTIEVHYTMAMPKPKLDQELPQEDWVSCISSAYELNGSNFILFNLLFRQKQKKQSSPLPQCSTAASVCSMKKGTASLQSTCPKSPSRAAP